MWNTHMLQQESAPLFQHVVPVCSRWQLYLLMRSDFIKDSPSEPSPGLLTQMLQWAVAHGSSMFGTETRAKEELREEEKLSCYERHELSKSLIARVKLSTLWMYRLCVYGR